MSMDYVVAAVKFDKATLGKAADDDSATMLALLLLLGSSILSGVLAYVNEDIGAFGFLLSEDPDSAATFFMIGLLIQLLFLLFFAFMYSISLKLFGGSASVMQVMRIWGFTNVWSIIGILVGLVVPSLAGIFQLLALIAFLLGAAAFSGKSEIVAFIALIVAAILTVILLFILVIALIVTIFL